MTFPSDILRELASFGDLPIRSVQEVPAPSNKRDRQQTHDQVVNGNVSNNDLLSPTEDDSSRPRRPMPRVKANVRAGTGGSTSPTTAKSLASKSPTGRHPMSTQGSLASLTAIPGAMPGGPPGQWFPANSNGGMSLPQQSPQQHQTYPIDTSPGGTMTDGSGMMGSFFAPGYPSLPLSSMSTPSSSSNSMHQGHSPPTPLDAPSFSQSSSQSHTQSGQVWDGIFTQQPFNNAAPGIPSSSFFTPFLGYQGGGGSMGFAAEAQALLENEDVSAAWGAGLNVEYVHYYL